MKMCSWIKTRQLWNSIARKAGGEKHTKQFTLIIKSAAGAFVIFYAFLCIAERHSVMCKWILRMANCGFVSLSSDLLKSNSKGKSIITAMHLRWRETHNCRLCIITCLRCTQRCYLIQPACNAATMQKLWMNTKCALNGWWNANRSYQVKSDYEKSLKAATKKHRIQ